MNKKILIPLLSALLLLSFFSSCERDANVDLPETPPKLVVVSFLTPQDTMLTVSVTRSKPIFESYNVNTSSAVTDANVVMSSGANAIQLTFDATDGLYRAPVTSFPVVAGNTYSLSVTTPRGESASANTTVPAHNGVQGFSVTMTDSLVETTGYYDVHTWFEFRVTDYAGEENQYRFFTAIIMRDTLTNDTSTVRYRNSLFTDYNADGQQLGQQLEGQWGMYDPTSTKKVIGYDCWMLNVNKDYYDFHNSLYNYNGGDDPFSEPTIIYSNMKGGLGVFAAANGSRIRIYR